MSLSDGELAAGLAASAGRILLEVRASGLFAGKALGAAGDAVANRFLVDALRLQRPEDGVLSEEAKDTPERLSKSRVWIIDPLDGTREYAAGLDDWAVHIGLSVDGVPHVGSVAVPARDAVHTTDDPVHVRGASRSPPRIVVSRSRAPDIARLVGETMHATMIPMGSAGAKAMAVVRGEAEIYLHAGGQHQWDNCAPAAVALAAGLHVSRIDGSQIVYNQPDTNLPDLLICRKEWAAPVLDAVSACHQAQG